LANKISKIREFNRFYTNILGLLKDRLLDSPASLTEGRVLFEIKERPHCKAGDLIELLTIDRGYLSRLLKKLEKHGWIAKEVSREDRRVRSLRLTAAGQALVEELERRSEAQVESLIQPLSAQERADLLQAMDSIKKLFSKNGPLSEPN